MRLDEIVALKEEAKKDLEALERVERLMVAKNGSNPKADDRQIPLIASETIQNVAETEEYDTEAPADSLRGTIERVVNSDTTVRWTTQKVLARLQDMKYDLRAKKPIYSVGQALNILANKGRIRLARKGAGSAPNIYKAKVHDLGPTRSPVADVEPTLTQ